MHAIVRLGLTLMVATWHGNAAAQSTVAPNKSSPQFSRLDSNKDGFLSYQEARADKELAGHFALSDANRDGKLSEDEFLKFKAAQARQRAGNAVTISDGAITSKVKLAVLRAKDLKSADVRVDTIAGVVKLSGAVDNAQQAARVVQLASRVKGVRKVESRLTLRQ